MSFFPDNQTQAPKELAERLAGICKPVRQTEAGRLLFLRRLLVKDAMPLQLVAFSAVLRQGGVSNNVEAFLD